MSEKMGQSIESNEVKVRLQATPEDVENVKKSIEYSNHLTKANDVLKVLDFPDNIEESYRKILLKQDNKILEEMAKKSKNEILTFIAKEQTKVTENTKEQNIKIESEESKKLDIENKKNEQKLSQIDSKSNEKDAQNKQENHRENQKLNQKETKLNQDIQKIKSVFTPQILEQNSDIAWNFALIGEIDKKISNEKDDTKKTKLINEKDKALKEVLNILKLPWKLQSIIEQLWWADKNNPKYLEFKNTLVWLDSWFDKYFQDLENINSWNSLNASEVINWIEKDSWWMIDIDLNSNIPTSKLSLIWSHYSFDEEIDKKAYSEIMGKWEQELDDAQNSEAVLKGLHKPFDSLWRNIRENWGKESLKDKINESVSNFSKNLFWDLDEVYKKTSIESDIQIKESDINSFTDIKSENDLKSKFENLKDKFWKIKEKIEDFKTSIMNKYKWEIKNVLALKSEKQEKQVKVLGFMQDSGFDLIPKEISDRFIWQMQWNTLNVPWLDLDVKNINLKNGNFWESVLYKDDCLNIHAKTNMLKFMNKMISWDINEPLKVESIANGTETINPSSLQNKFLEAWIVDNLGWKEWKISENLSKWNNWWIENKA